MPTLSNVLRGKKAKHNGKVFEQFLKNEANRNHWEVIQIPDGCRTLHKNKLMRIKSPFDFVFAKRGSVIFADAKSCSAKSFAKSAITTHQLHKLWALYNQNLTSGYIVNFTTLNKICFFDAETLLKLWSGQSLNPDDGLVIGDDKGINLDLILT